MKTHFPAYVVPDIPEPIRSAVYELKRRLRYRAAKLPLEITVARSSGVGPIPPGYSIQALVQELECLLASHRAFDSRFSGVESFPNTSNYYLAPKDRTPFDRMNQSLSRSTIGFSSSRWPYTIVPCDWEIS